MPATPSQRSPSSPLDDNPFALTPPAPPERKTTLRVILLLSAVAHVTIFVLVSRQPPEKAPPARPTDTVRVLRGEVTESGGEMGLRLSGYAEVAVPAGGRR